MINKPWILDEIRHFLDQEYSYNGAARALNCEQSFTHKSAILYFLMVSPLT